MPVFQVRYERGLHLPDLGLWLDPQIPIQGPERVFISHAHSDHTGRHREILVSHPTSQLIRTRLRGEWAEHILPYGEPHKFSHHSESFSITALPAGHIFGSTMALLEHSGGSLLYTGDFKLRPGLSAEPCQPRNADVLIMETTYGRPHYRFPPTAEVLAGVVRFCREALDNDEIPVLLGYSLGKSQEILCSLRDANLPIMLHDKIHQLTQIYQQFGQCFPPYERFNASTAKGNVLLCPPGAQASSLFRNIGPVRTAIMTGWAMDPACRFRYQSQAAFPISDHADYTDLIELVKQVNPKQVYTLHGFAADFARDLRERGLEARPLSEQEQLALPFGELGHAPSLAKGRRAALSSLAKHTSSLVADDKVLTSHDSLVPPDSLLSFHSFSEVARQIGATSKKLEKTRLLAEYLRQLDADPLGHVITWFTGRPFPAVQSKVLQLGWAIIRDALCTAGDLDQDAFGQIYLKHSDLGETACEILSQQPSVTAALNLKMVQAVFEQLYAARGSKGKLPYLIQALGQCTPLEGKYLIKILTGDLRIGLKEGLVEEAIAQAFDLPLHDVKQANLVLGNIGETAQLARAQSLHTASLIPFRPIKYMLASPEESSADIWKRVQEWAQPPTPDQPMAQHVAWLEDKYDGVRCQLHKVGSKVSLYSRDLKDITATFQEIADLHRANADHGYVLDGELVAMRGEVVLPFSELQRRLGRKESDLFLADEIPVHYVAFDLLWLNERSLMGVPLRERRKALEELAQPSLTPWRLSRITQATSPEETEQAFDQARSRGNEGLMVKDPESLYSPGRRGLSWLKLKKAYATLDCVVVGAEFGHGKRKAVLSDYTFAVRDEASGQLKTIGKAFSGLTDQEISKLTKHFQSKTIHREGRYFAVEPDVILEVAFDALQRSDRHSSGLAMRFPRIVRIRTDKSLADIDTLAAAEKLVRPGPTRKTSARKKLQRP